MAENTKTPPNQDPRQRSSQGDVNKPQKPGSGMPGANPDRNRPDQPNRPEMDPDRDRQGVNRPEIDPDRDDRQGGNKPMPGDKDDVVDGDVDDLDEDESTQRMDR